MNGVPDLLVVDLDGTLLCPRGHVSKLNRRALDQAREAGVELMIATGRTHAECGDILEAIGYEGPMVIASGAALVDWPTGTTLDRATMDVQDVVAVTEIITSHGNAALLLKDSHVASLDYLVIGEADLHPVSRWWFELHGVTYRCASSPNQDEHPGHTIRVASIGDPGEMDAAAAEVDSTVGDRISWRHWPAVGRESEEVHMLEIFHKGVDKWSMIDVYRRHRGIDVSRVAAIGDGLNDIEMLSQAGFGIAVSNATAPVRAAADAETLSHSEDGVAHAVDRLLEGWS